MSRNAATRALDPLGEQIGRAITEKRLLGLRYHGRARVVEPHDYGLKGDRPRLLVYQLIDERTRAVSGWRLLDLAKIEELVVLDQTFAGSRGDRHHRHHEWDELFARVS